MSQVENLLHQSLEADPSDWSIRLELASKKAARNAIDEVRTLLLTAPVVPTEAEMHRIVELTNQTGDVESLRQVASTFVQTNPSSSWGQFITAQTSLHTGHAAEARAHYEAAISIDPSLVDHEFEKGLPGLSTDTGALAARALRPPGESAGGAEVDATAMEGTGPQRAFFVAEGEAVCAAEKEPDAKQKVSALTVAILVHAVIFVLATIYNVATYRPKPPQIEVSSLPNLDDDMIETKEIKKPERRVTQSSASAQVNVMSVQAASSVSLPSVDVTVEAFDPIGLGADVGMSMSLDTGDAGGMVAFFGSRSASKKVVFVVDYSGSMNGAKDKLMRSELTKSIKALPPSVEYQLIFFSGPAWYAGQVDDGKPEKDKEGMFREVKDGSRGYKWYAGWDEKARGSDERILYHYDKGEKELPEGKYIKATKSNIRKSLKHIEETRLTLGTDWRWPLRMAMNMEPDTIFFMTDGAFGTKGVSKTEMIDELLAYNRRKGRAKINTICMMVLNARKELEQLAEGTRGEFTLVLEDGTPVRGRDLDKQ